MKIVSASNDRFKFLESLLETKEIKKKQRALIFGERVVRELQERHPEVIEELIGAEETEVKGLTLELHPKLFDRLDVFGTHAPIALVKIPEFSDWTELKPEGCALLIPFQDPGNVGAVIRTAAAMGVKDLVFLEGAAHPFHPKSVRAASGTLFQMNFFKGPPLKDIKNLKVPLVGLDSRGTDLQKYRFPKNFWLLPGVEGPGLPDHLKFEALVRIPMSAGVESLNAQVATSIALYEWKRQKSV